MIVSFEFGYCYLWKFKKVGVFFWGYIILCLLVYCEDEGIDNIYYFVEICFIFLWWILLVVGDF